MAIVLNGDNVLAGRIKKKQQLKEELQKEIRIIRNNLWSLRKRRIVGYFTGAFKDRAQIDICKKNLKSTRSHLGKLNEEIYRLIRGYQGEEQIMGVLKKELSDDFYVICGKKIEVNGEKAELDHILLGPKGLICIEVKNMSGSFYLDANGKNWLKAPFSKPDALKVPVANPLEQVNRGANILKQLLMEKSKFTDINFYSLVVFTGSKCLFYGIKNRVKMPTPLLLKDELIPYIDSLPPDEKLSNNSDIKVLSQIILNLPS